MKNCPFCQNQIVDDAVFCPNCGKKIPAGSPDPEPASNPFAAGAAQEEFSTAGNAQKNANDYAAGNTQAGPNTYTQNNANSYTTGSNNTNTYYAPPAYRPNPYDHTREFDSKDISEHKVYAMLPYLLGMMGIIIALLAVHESPYTSFHIRQSLKFTVTNALMLIVLALLWWTILVPIAYVVLVVILFVIRIICFFQICSGRAQEPAIIRSLPFLK